jgi:hypothetical protein
LIWVMSCKSRALYHPKSYESEYRCFLMCTPWFLQRNCLETNFGNPDAIRSTLEWWERRRVLSPWRNLHEDWGQVGRAVWSV